MEVQSGEQVIGGSSCAQVPARRWDLRWLCLVLVIAAAGVALRIYPSAGFTRVGFDEILYRLYVEELSQRGVLHYPQIVESYMAVQRNLPTSVLPPVRFLYIFCSYLWRSAFSTSSLAALHHVACLFSILTLGIAFFFTRRLAGKWPAVGVLALMSFAPTQIHMSQHALIDGFFAFWALSALWLLWENLQSPGRPLLLALYTAVLMLMVLTKENAFFVFVAFCLILLTNRWLKFGTVTPKLLICTVAGPALAVLVLVLLAGGVPKLFAMYVEFVAKSLNLPYAVQTGDGPWSRYLVDWMIMSPVILLLGLGTVFQLDRNKKPLVFLSVFVAGSYLVMCNVKYGMNLRYTNMWDMPLRLLALTQLAALCDSFGARKHLLVALAVAAICALELGQYRTFFVENPLYELVDDGLLRACKMVKEPKSLSR